MSLSYCWCKHNNYKKGVPHEPWGWPILAPVRFQSNLVWEGNQLSVPANSVPLEEKEYKHTGKCSLFVHPSHMHPRLAWMPPVSTVELLVCQLGVLSPCNSQAWNWTGKDCYHLEQNHAAGINDNLCEPTKFIQHLPVTFLGSLGGLKVCSSIGLVWQPSSWLPTELLMWWFNKADKYPFPGQKSQVRSVLHACEEVHQWQLNGSLTHHELDVASTRPVISSFSCLGPST